MKLDHDCPGNDTAIWGNVTLDQCITIGRASSAVIGVQYNNGICWLKSAMTNCVDQPDPGVTAWIQDPKVILGYDCPGNDIGQRDTPSPSECMKNCQKTEGCLGVSFSSTMKKCWLKSKLEQCGPISQPVIMIKNQTNCPANDIIWTESVNLTQCIEMCKSIAYCIAVQFNMQGCVLKSAADNCTQDPHGFMVFMRDPNFREGFGCLGNDLEGEISNITMNECSTRCQNRNGCMGASYNLNSNKCWLKSKMENCQSTAQPIATIYIRKDCYGHDIERYDPKDPEDCVSKCKSKPECHGVQFNPRDGCFLKSSLASCSEEPLGTIIHVRDPIIREGFDCYGNDIGHISNTTASDCAIQCSGESGCIGFSYNPSSNECWLKFKLDDCRSHINSSVTVKVRHDCPGGDIDSIKTRSLDQCIE